MNHNTFPIIIRDNSFNETVLFVDFETTIKQLKTQLESIYEKSIELMSLSYHGKGLRSDRCLSYYDIEHNSIIHLNFRLLAGFEFLFYDIIENNFHNLDVEKTGPTSIKRLTLDKGINISGICKFRDCSENGKMVVCHIEKDSYDFINEEEMAKCPICSAMFCVINCGFYKCKFTFEGKKYNPITRKYDSIKKETFETKESNYMKFDQNHCEKKIKWIELKVKIDKYYDI